MKKFIPKSLSLLLCVTLVLSTMVSVFGGIFVSAAEEEDIAELQAAWGAMTETQLMQTGFRPVKNAATAHVGKTDENYAFSTQTPTSTADAIAAGIDLTGITAADLGDTVATYDFEYDNYGMVVFSTNDVVGYHSSYNRNSFGSAGIGEAYLYLKVNSNASTATLGAWNWDGPGLKQQGLVNQNVLTVEPGTTGWIKISFEDIFGANWKTTYADAATRNLSTFTIFAKSEGADMNITFGSVVATKTAPVPSDAETESWGIAEWIKAAMDFDTSNYANTEQFNALVKTLLLKYENVTIDMFKELWASMGARVDLPRYPSSTYNYDTNSATINALDNHNNIKKFYDLSGITVADLGAYATTVDFAHGSADAMVRINFSQMLDAYKGGYDPTANGMEGLEQYEDIYLYYKVNDVTSSGSIRLWGYRKDPIGQINGSTISITEEDEAKGWQKIRLSQLYDWKTWFTTNASNNPRPSLRAIELQAMGGLDANISVGSWVAVASVALPEGSDSWSLEEWCVAAINMDKDDYCNPEALDKLLSVLSKTEGLKEAIALARIQKAWGEMTKKELVQTNFRPVKIAHSDDVRSSNAEYNVNTSQTPVSTATAIDNGLDITGITAADLGDTVATYNMGYLKTADDAEGTGKYAMVVFGNSTVVGYHTSFDKGVGWSSAGVKDAYLYLKVNSNTSTNGVGVLDAWRWDNPGWKQQGQIGDEILKVSGANTGWIKVSFEDIFGANWKTTYAEANDRSLGTFTIYTEDANTNMNITFGSVVTLMGVDLPVGYADFSISDWLVAATELAESGVEYNGLDEILELIREYVTVELSSDVQYLYDAWAAMSVKDANRENGFENNATQHVVNKAGGASVAVNKDLANAQDVYLYYKVDSLESEGTLRVATVGEDLGIYPNGSNKVYINEDDIGKWRKLSVDDFTAGLGSASTLTANYDLQDWRETFTGNNKLQSINLYAGDGLNAKISVSKAFVVDVVNFNEEMFEWDLEDWLIAADNLDISGYENTATFTTRLKELKVKYADTLGVALLKNAWSKLRSGGNAVALHDGCDSWSVLQWVTNTEEVAKGYENNELFLENLELFKLLNADEYYINKIQSAWSGLRTYVRNIYYPNSATVGTVTKADTPSSEFETMGSVTGQYVKKAGAAANVQYSDKSYTTDDMVYDQYRAFDKTIEDDMVIRVKIDNSGEKPFTPGTFVARIHLCYVPGGGTALTYNVTEDDYNRGYIDISFDEVMTTGKNGHMIGWSGLVANYPAYNWPADWRDAVNTGTTYKDSGDRTLTFRYIALEFDADIAATMELSSVVSTKAVAMPTGTGNWTLQRWALEAQKVLEGNIQNPEELEAVLDEIKASDMEIEKVLTLRETARATTKQTFNNEVNTGSLEKAGMNCENDDERNHFISDFYNRVYVPASGQFSFAVSPPATADQDAYIVYRINSVTTPGDIQIALQTSAPFSNSISALKLPVNADEEGQWRVVKLSDIVTSSGYYDAWYRQCLFRGLTRHGDHWEDYVNYGPISGLYFTSSGAEFTIDIFEVDYDAYLNVDVADGSTASILEAAAALDATGYKNADAFNEAVAELNADNKSGDATGDGRVNVADLLRVKRATVDPTVEVYMFAADMDADGSLTAYDLGAIQDKLLA